MPVHKGKDSKGKFFQWGDQKKYYYKTERGKIIAKAKATLQGRAIKYMESTYRK